MNPAMLRKIQQMQKDLQKAQKDLEDTIFVGTAGGVVEVTVKGTKDILGIKIDKDAVEGPEDVEMLEETILAAIKDAFKKVDDKSNQVMGQFNIPGMGGLF